MDTNENLRNFWKLNRDSIKRGQNVETVKEKIKSRESDYKKYIKPQRDFADMIIQFFSESIDNNKPINEKNNINLKLQLTLDANIDIEPILESLNIKFDWDYNEDLKTQYIILNEEPNVNFQWLAEDKIVNLNEILSPNSSFSKGYNGFIQLMFIIMIVENLKKKNLV